MREKPKVARFSVASCFSCFPSPVNFTIYSSALDILVLREFEKVVAGRRKSVKYYFQCTFCGERRSIHERKSCQKRFAVNSRNWSGFLLYFLSVLRWSFALEPRSPRGACIPHSHFDLRWNIRHLNCIIADYCFLAKT